MKKIIIVETDCHGSGYIYANNEVHSYTYDDGYFGDVYQTISALIDLGAIDKSEVSLYSDMGEVMDALAHYEKLKNILDNPN